MDGCSENRGEEFEILLPSESGADVLPSPRQSLQGPLTWSIKWKNPGPGKLLARFRTECGGGELSSAESIVFQGELRELINSLSAGVLLSREAARDGSFKASQN